MIKNNSFSKSIAVLVSGSLLAQLITVITAPFLTRLFSTEAIGVYSYVLSIAAIFMPVINGRYDMSIVTEEEEKRVYPLIKLSLLIGFFASVIITIGYIIYISYFSKEFSNYLFTAWYMFIILLTYGVLNVLTSYNNRKKEYKIISSVYVIRTSCQNIGAILMGLFSMGITGLLFPYTVGQLLGINQQAKSLKPHIKDMKNVKASEMLEVLKLHRKQPLFSTPALLANGFSYSSITIFIGALFGMSVVGYYSISVRLLGLPLSIISGNVSKVFFESASREYNETNQFYQSFIKTVLFQVILAIPIVIGLMTFSPEVFGFVFGEEWEIAGKYVVILAPMFGLRFIVSSISPGMIIAKKQNSELALQIVFIVASVISFFVAKIGDFSVENYLISVSFLFSLSYIAFLLAVFKYSKQNK